MDSIGDVRCNLKTLIKEKEIRERRDTTYEMIQEETGINPGTLSALANDKTRRYDAHVLARLCHFFNCTVGDLLEYVPPDAQGETHAHTNAPTAATD